MSIGKITHPFGRTSRRLVTVVLTSVALISPQLLSSVPAQAFVAGQPPCNGATCVGKSPNIVNREGTSCASDATDLVTVVWGATYVLRYSSFCHANWVKSYMAGSGGVPAGPNTCCSYYAQTKNGHVERGDSYYSPMVDGTQSAGCGSLEGVYFAGMTPLR